MIPYSVGVVNTFHSNNFTYGYFAVRSKNPSGPATWPAWWLTGKNNWPPEIDIFEMYGKSTGKDVNTQTMTIHTGKVETHTKQMMMKKIRVSEDTDSSFHIYSCLWTPKKIDFYTDGIKVKSIRLNRWMAQFLKEPMYLILNNALENTYIPQLIASGNKTSDFQVDWVQVYQLHRIPLQP
jgi:beta-glucanase (GH16 family)